MIRETTALGAAYLAGLATGFWKDINEIEGNWNLDITFEPEMENARREELLTGWQRAVERSKGWIQPEI